ncbi:sensor histidine kinase [Phytohabitans rumicis]|uniref:histidine kinase n=1 Tax=Phytohabitans rumicis TaxID=1076125 RepID=A0A6V8LKN2_9ACTN|nr:HAMP domain-containing sensor histidine kinase [Phytohabitans rumicis]GFJ94726.1 sensor histidine kinase [Phytohabitans rumicis]
MFSSRPSSWSLRARLLAAVIALLAVVCLVIGTVTTLALRHSLLDRLDSQLNEAAQAPPDGKPGGYGSPDHFRAGQPPGTLTATVSNGAVTSAYVLLKSRPGPPDEQPASAEAVQALAGLPEDGKPHTVDLGDDLGDYRLVVTEQAGRTTITGLPMEDLQDTVFWMVWVEVSVVAGGLLLAGGVGALIIGGSLRPLRRVVATASRVAELPLDRGEVALSVRVPEKDTDPRTEVGQVGAAFNRMLGHVARALTARQASEMRVRQFVADASHELRTPLAAIRGYAEVTRRGRDAVPPDVAHALRRVESESARMTTLVDDLLLLARLDSGRPLETEPVDLSMLLIDAISDAHVAGPDHRWRLDLPEEAIAVPGDAARLHQVLANLLANARTHTPPGTEVTAVLRVAPDGSAVISVVDNGPGIAPELQAEVFERFARGDSSRSRAAGSTGLGLAIVAAVVEAHHGTVEVSSKPGHTEFTVTLPGR